MRNFKSVGISVVLSLLASFARAEVPSALNVQGRVDAPSATLSGTASILLNGAPTGFSQAFSVPTDGFGVFNLTLTGMSSSTFAGTGSFTLELGLTSPSVQTITVPLDTVSFAFRAAAADTLSPGSPIFLDIAALNSSTTSLAAQLTQVATDTTTLQGRFTQVAVDTTALQAQFAQVGVDTTALQGQFAQVAVDTTALQAQFAQIGVDTTALQGQFAQVAIDTTALQAQFAQVGVDTAALQGQFAQVAVDTTALQAQFAQVGVDTAALQGQFAQVAVDTTALQGQFAQVAVDTTALQGQFAQVAVDTTALQVNIDSKVSKVGDTMTGSLNLTNAGINLTGSNGSIVSQSSITASAFFGDGSGLTNLPGGGGGADADWTVVGNDMFSAVSGNVGVGTNSPSSKFHVATFGGTSLGTGFRIGGDLFAWELQPLSFNNRLQFKFKDGQIPFTLKTDGILLKAIDGGLGTLTFDVLRSCGGFLGTNPGRYNFNIGGATAFTVQRLCAPSPSTPPLVAVFGDFAVTGSKSFVQDHPNDPTKQISYYASEGPEPITFVRGTAQLVNGAAIINLPEHFELVTSTSAPLTTQLTPMGDCKGLYVGQQSLTQITVGELQGGASNVQFSYLVQGVRVGFENAPVIQNKPTE